MRQRPVTTISYGCAGWICGGLLGVLVGIIAVVYFAQIYPTLSGNSVFISSRVDIRQLSSHFLESGWVLALAGATSGIWAVRYGTCNRRWMLPLVGAAGGVVLFYLTAPFYFFYEQPNLPVMNHAALVKFEVWEFALAGFTLALAFRYWRWLAVAAVLFSAKSIIGGSLVAAIYLAVRATLLSGIVIAIVRGLSWISGRVKAETAPAQIHPASDSLPEGDVERFSDSNEDPIEREELAFEDRKTSIPDSPVQLISVDLVKRLPRLDRTRTIVVAIAVISILAVHWSCSAVSDSPGGVSERVVREVLQGRAEFKSGPIVRIAEMRPDSPTHEVFGTVRNTASGETGDYRVVLQKISRKEVEMRDRLLGPRKRADQGSGTWVIFACFVHGEQHLEIADHLW